MPAALLFIVFNLVLIAMPDTDLKVGTYVDFYVKTAKQYGLDVQSKVDEVKVSFEPLLHPMNAVCRVRHTKGKIYSRRIIIDPVVWERMTYFGREQLILHEFSHCVFAAAHITTRKDGIPVSIMNTHSLPDRIYVPNREYYIKVLFTKDIHDKMFL